MTNILSVSSKMSHPIRTMTRVINLCIAITVPVMLIYYPPVNPTWEVMGVMLSIVLGLFSIVGLWPRMRVTLLGHVVHNPEVHTTTYFLLGMIIIALSIASPAVAMEWFAFFVLVGAMMVFDAITSMTYLLKSGKPTQSAITADNVTHQTHKAA
jgi:hypothetical protein